MSIPPKFAVSNVVGFLKGKSAITIALQFGNKQRNFTGENFWARGYFVSTVGLGLNYYNCVNLQRDVRIAYLVKKSICGFSYAVLFSTDTELDALTLLRYYKARFQIEFLFRDAKQFTGLCDCQARSEEALYSHFNANFTALNLIRWHDRENAKERKTISASR